MDTTKKTASPDAMAELHNRVAEKLTELVTSKEVSAADLSVAVKFLKDNHINVDLNTDGSRPLHVLAYNLPCPGQAVGQES